MASFLSKLFKTDKRDTTYQGPKPYGSLMEAQGGADYYKNITGRLAGQGVGYGDTYADQATNPIIARMRGQFASRDIPALTSELSATGRRKGSAGFDQMSRAYNQQGLDEGAVYADAYNQNEQQKRTEINDALGRLGEFNKGDYDARSNIADFENANNNRQVQEEDARRSTVRDLRMRGLGSAMMFIPGAQGAAGGMSQSYQPQYSGSQVNQAIQQPSWASRLKMPNAGSPYAPTTRMR
jgi:hypothetical protein